MDIINTITPFLIILIIMFFMIYFPESRNKKNKKELIKSLKKGEEVVTISGIRGKITSIKKETIVIKSAISTLEIEKSAVEKKVK